MTKDTAVWICDFIIKNYDMVWQEDWYELQDVLLEAVIKDASRGGYARTLVDKYPCFFGEEK